MKLLGVLMVLFCFSCKSSGETGGVSRMFTWNKGYIDTAKQKWIEGDAGLKSAINTVVANANIQLTAGPFSVVFDDLMPPSNDKHDYMSCGAYWWPNPDTSDGLPWIRRDGHVNPASVGDGKAMAGLRAACLNLGLAYYLTDDECYAAHAAYLLRVFFLEEDTRMNPRILYSQVIPGVSPGYCSVADIANYLRSVFETAGILERSPHWTDADKEGLQAWSLQLLQFYGQSDCKHQRDDPANHGTNFDLMTALLAMYADQEDVARARIVHFRDNRMPGQIALDGRNPLEMTRADNFMYHCYNWQVMSYLAELAEHFTDIDLWNYAMPDGRGMRLALEFIIPYMIGEKDWTFWPGESFARTPERYMRCLRSAALAYDSFRYERFIKEIGYSSLERDYENIIHPRFALTTIDGDIDHDGDVDFADFVIMARAWLCSAGEACWNRSADVSVPEDGVIDLKDLHVLCNLWLDSM